MKRSIHLSIAAVATSLATARLTSDVNAAIDVMLGKSAATADVTGDGQVDIADVNAIIDQMLGK
ncbi:MAG: hypothetical protein J5980_05425 [Muribaculaceae bacterium]|nr:hypothetical protein [Muribaculaceae bacterium]